MGPEFRGREGEPGVEVDVGVVRPGLGRVCARAGIDAGVMGMGSERRLGEELDCCNTCAVTDN